MRYFRFLKYITLDPVNLGIKAKLLALFACFCSIFFIALLTKIVSPWEGFPMIVASMGASAVILFFIPNSPLAQPWPFVGGQILSAVVGMACALNISETSTAAAMAVGASIVVMLLCRCLHPPAAATSLTPVMAGHSITSLGYSFVLVPVAINVFCMLLLAIIINRWIMKRDYPNPLPIKKEDTQRYDALDPTQPIGFTEQDLNFALKDQDVFIDMSYSKLSQILTQAERNSFKRVRGNILCTDIMSSVIFSVEYGTEVEEAWKIMHKNNLKAMPVVDNAQRVIGIITWNDFFKFIDLDIYEGFQKKFRHFIRRTDDVSASKPEFVGYIMSKEVMTISENTHIADLIPLMSVQGFRQIPIVNAERRLVGMIYQTNLIAALYNEALAHHL
ncbi:MAG: HPP family protein [Methylococcales bacterium]|nr:HPP family protein [Methylococcales bacterium]